MKSHLLTYLKYSFFLLFLFGPLTSCKEKPSLIKEYELKVENSEPFFKLSLAQWSLNKAIRSGEMNPFDFAKKASEMGFEGLEYVSQLYTKKLETMSMESLLDSLKSKSDEYKINNVLIMVDGEGDLATTDQALRDQAVENHKKWVDAAAFLGCHAIRVNTFGTNDPELWLPAVQDGLKKLSTYAATKNINILVENHGWLSSDAPLVTKAIEGVAMENCGTLPDFGNWCVKRKEGELWGDCLEEYPDKYEGTQLLMPFAKAVSAKSYDFNESGDETSLDYSKLMQIVKDANYTGYVGIEYEGERLGEEAGILATKDLLLKVAKNLN